jgi:hypothetical protein
LEWYEQSKFLFNAINYYFTMKGAYRDDNGKPVILESVRQAKLELEKLNLDHEYAPIAGLQSFIDKSIEFAYGVDAAVIKEKRVAAIQTLSGTGACRVTGEFIARFFGKSKKIYLPDPTVRSIHDNLSLPPQCYLLQCFFILPLKKYLWVVAESLRRDEECRSRARDLPLLQEGGQRLGLRGPSRRCQDCRAWFRVLVASMRA